MALEQQFYDKVIEAVAPKSADFLLFKTGMMWDWEAPALGVNYAQQQLVSTMPSYIGEGQAPFFSSSGTSIYDAYSTVLTSVKLDASTEQAQQLKGIDDQLAVLMKKKMDANRTYLEMYNDAKGGDPDFQSYTDWLKDNFYYDTLHSNDEEIKMLSQKKADIASASSFKWSEAYTALNSKAGFVKVVDPNESTSHQVPNFVVGANAIDWANKVAGGKGNETTISLYSNKHYESKSKHTFTTESHFLFFYTKTTHTKTTLDVENAQTKIDIKYDALEMINVTPDSRWYKQAYLNQMGQLGKWLNNMTTEQVFGPQGFHYVITGFVVGYRPSIDLTTSSDITHQVNETLSSGGGISLGPISIGASGSHSSEEYSFEQSGNSLHIHSKSKYGRIIGIIAKNPYY